MSKIIQIRSRGIKPTTRVLYLHRKWEERTWKKILRIFRKSCKNFEEFLLKLEISLPKDGAQNLEQ